MEKISLFLKQFGLLVGIGAVGTAMLIYGLWSVFKPQEVRVEIVSSPSDASQQVIYVDVAGAVEKPGVYGVPSNSRVGDAIVVAGGLSARADRDWVAETLNLASQVEDGDKIYIPRIKEEIQVVESRVEIGPTKSTGKVNINTASLSELNNLTGIGEVRAKTIMDNRPYSNVDDLVSKAKIPQSVYEKIKDQVTIY